MQSRLRSALVTLGLITFSACATAASGDDNNASLHGVVLGTYQLASESDVNGQDVDDEGNGQLYLLGTLDMGPGTWHLELRGSTTPADNGISSFYGSNASVGETVNSDGEGRIAVTQLFYQMPVGPGRIRAGLLDPTAVLDGNTVANDEYTQFLAGRFVNNPTIGFPSFVLGAAYQGHATKHIGYKLFAGSDSGLQAENDPTYDNVFDITEGDKGAFTAAELNWHANGYMLKGGVWYDTGEVSVFDSSGSEHGYGIYALAGAPLGEGHLLGRAGIANEDAQLAANFVSLAYQRPLMLGQRDTVLGIAVARTGPSDAIDAFDSAPIYQAEAYWRIHVTGPFYFSPDIQYITNAGFREDRDGAVIGGARATVTF